MQKTRRCPKLIKPTSSRPAMKFKRKKGRRDLSGKFVILLNRKSKKVGALLKFVDRKTCEVVTGIAIKKCDLKQTSKKFIISPEKHKRLLNTVEVIVNLKFQRRYERVVAKLAREEYKKKADIKRFAMTMDEIEKFSDEAIEPVKTPAVNEQPPNVKPAPVGSIRPFKPAPTPIGSVTLVPVKSAPTQVKPITPITIKIFNCLFCNHKFTNQQMYLDHTKTHEKRDSSDSESELVIDDDVMLVIDSEPVQLPVGAQKIIKTTLVEEAPETFVCSKYSCQQHFDTEQALIDHMKVHPKSADFPCKMGKCPAVYGNESALQAHVFLKHTPSVNPKVQGRRKSMYVIYPPKPNETTPQRVASPVPSTSANGKITFERFNSKSKKSFICRICSTSFTARQLLDRHVIAQHISKLFHCYKCTAAFPMLGLFTHLKTVHADCYAEPQYMQTMSDAESMSLHQCAFCQFSSRFRNRVETHLRFEHYEEFEKSEDKEQQASSSDSLEELMNPATAQIIAETEEQLKKIEIEKRPRRPQNDPSFKFRCVRCQRRFVKSCTLKNHKCDRLVVAHIEKPQPEAANITILPPAPAPSNNLVVVNGFHRCPRCPQVFTDKIHYQRHISAVHDMQQTPKTGFYGTIIN